MTNLNEISFILNFFTQLKFKIIWFVNCLVDINWPPLRVFKANFSNDSPQSFVLTKG